MEGHYPLYITTDQVDCLARFFRYLQDFLTRDATEVKYGGKNEKKNP